MPHIFLLITATNTKKDELKDRSNQSGHLAKIGEKVDTEIEILRTKYIATHNMVVLVIWLMLLQLIIID